ncbi:hypothetical protein D046_4218B, partial [Vibrio parahaemolyticus V-223/04]
RKSHRKSVAFCFCIVPY